jgi:hypothetical protein
MSLSGYYGAEWHNYRYIGKDLERNWTGLIELSSRPFYLEGLRERSRKSKVGLTRALEKISVGLLLSTGPECYLCANSLSGTPLARNKGGKSSVVHFPCYKTNLLRVTRTLVVNAVPLRGDLWRDYRLISRLSVILPLVIGVPSAGHATHILCVAAMREHFVRIIEPMLQERKGNVLQS